MEYLIGVGLAAGVFLFARFTGLDRDRAFYATVTMVVASYYGLFAILGGSMAALGVESVFIAGFVLAAVLGFKRNMWLVAAALAGHGVFDFFHSRLVTNPGLPVWWPGFCGSYDVVAGAGLAWMIWSGRTGAKA